MQDRSLRTLHFLGSAVKGTLVNESIKFHPYFGTQVCGHCYETATWQIVDNGWTDYECNAHTLQWWAKELREVSNGNHA